MAPGHRRHRARPLHLPRARPPRRRPDLGRVRRPHRLDLPRRDPAGAPARRRVTAAAVTAASARLGAGSGCSRMPERRRGRHTRAKAFRSGRNTRADINRISPPARAAGAPRTGRPPLGCGSSFVVVAVGDRPCRRHRHTSPTRSRATGETARAQAILARAGFKTPASENVLVKSKRLTVDDAGVPRDGARRRRRSCARCRR